MIVVGCVCWRGWALLTDAKHADEACGMSTSNSLLTTVFRHVRHLESSIDSLSLSHVCSRPAVAVAVAATAAAFAPIVGLSADSPSEPTSAG